MGGLGNQMFQYALGRRLALDHGNQIKLDLNWFVTQTKRRYELNQFNITLEVASSKDLEKFPHYSHSRFRRLLYNRIEKWIPRQARIIINEPSYGVFYPHVLEVTGNKYLVGYWQSERYFKPIEAYLREEFRLKQPLSVEDQVLATEMYCNPYSVCVHVRRGDYVSDYHINRYHYVCTPDYYDKTMRLMNEKLGGKAFFYVFSDDPTWCSSEMSYPSGYKIISNDKRSTADELIMMSNCQNAVISNSSFGWWGAWLCNNNEKIIIVPKIWFADSGYKTTDLIPENWLKLLDE